MQLVSQIKQQSKTRTEETGSFLQESYELSDKALTTAIQEIDGQERKFFQKLVDILGRFDTAQITSLDASLAELIDTYKRLKPKAVDQDKTSLEALKIENKNLTEELKITRDTMSNMIEEFGSMFGGGKDNEIDSESVVEQVAKSSRLAAEKARE